jgi:endonuclease/exonuclease/phosphatase family metal-dependent hydrolase
MLKNKLYKIKIAIIFLISLFSFALLNSCSSIDLLNSRVISDNTRSVELNEISLVTYNIKAIYDKEEGQVDSLIDFVHKDKFDFVIFQELFDESTRDEIIEKTDTNNFGTIISRVDYNSFPEFLFQDAGLFLMSKFPRVDLSNIDFGDDINNSNGVIHMILDKKISKTNDFLANKSVLGALFTIDDSTQLFLFTTHVQAIGTKEHKDFQLSQIKNFIDTSVKGVINSGAASLSKNLIVILAGDFNSNAYSIDRFNNLQNLLGYPRDLHKEFHGGKEEYTFAFRSGRPSRRFDYILAYDNIGEYALRRVNVKSIGVKNIKDKTGNSISDHLALKAKILIN